MLSRAVVLGCGPAGLLAAHACVKSLRFEEVTILSRPNKSQIHGAQYIHKFIPSIGMGQPTPVRQVLMGTPREYGRKVYGELYDPEQVNSSVLYAGSTNAWDMRRLYDALWDRYHKLIRPLDLAGPNSTTRMLYELTQPKSRTITFSTVPAKVLCMDSRRHSFGERRIWARGQTDKDDSFFNLLGEEDNTITLNGQEFPSWYRLSCIFGKRTVEWPPHRRMPVEGAVSVAKPLSTNCTCWDSWNFVKLGRYGRWQKGILADSAYYDVEAKLKDLSDQGVLR